MTYWGFILIWVPAFAALQTFVWGVGWLIMTRDVREAAYVAGLCCCTDTGDCLARQPV